MRNQVAFRVLMFSILHCAFCISLSGCQALGVAANAIPKITKAKYPGLKGQPVGIVVWADRGIQIDWGSIPLDLANEIQHNLDSERTEETKGTTFPYEPKSYVRFFRDHPGTESLPLTELAPKFDKITRLIYVEVQQFHTRAAEQVELFRGDGTVRLEVVEIDPHTGVARVAYSEEGITATFPRHVPAEGTPNFGDAKIYVGEIQALAREIGHRFVTHEADDDPK